MTTFYDPQILRLIGVACFFLTALFLLLGIFFFVKWRSVIRGERDLPENVQVKNTAGRTEKKTASKKSKKTHDETLSIDTGTSGKTLAIEENNNIPDPKSDRITERFKKNEDAVMHPVIQHVPSGNITDPLGDIPEFVIEKDVMWIFGEEKKTG